MRTLASVLMSLAAASAASAQGKDMHPEVVAAHAKKLAVALDMPHLAKIDSCLAAANAGLCDKTAGAISVAEACAASCSPSAAQSLAQRMPAAVTMYQKYTPQPSSPPSPSEAATPRTRRGWLRRGKKTPPSPPAESPAPSPPELANGWPAKELPAAAAPSPPGILGGWPKADSRTQSEREEEALLVQSAEALASDASGARASEAAGARALQPTNELLAAQSEALHEDRRVAHELQAAAAGYRRGTNGGHYRVGKAK